MVILFINLLLAFGKDYELENLESLEIALIEPITFSISSSPSLGYFWGLFVENSYSVDVERSYGFFVSDLTDLTEAVGRQYFKLNWRGNPKDYSIKLFLILKRPWKIDSTYVKVISLYIK